MFVGFGWRAYRLFKANSGDGSYLALVYLITIVLACLGSLTSWAFMSPFAYPLGLWLFAFIAAEATRQEALASSRLSGLQVDLGGHDIRDWNGSRSRPPQARRSVRQTALPRPSAVVDKDRLPRITFGIIVLNGEPFTRYCLRQLYPYAHEIIVVEGGHEDTRAVTTADGHSIDGTLEVLQRFRDEEDPEHKVRIVVRDGFWPKKDELGRDRTPQSRAYAELATGDYLWQVDIDEFYRDADLQAVLDMLAADPSTTAVSFKERVFWGDIQYLADGWALRRQTAGYHRVFKWGPGYRYVTHEPPTVHDASGRDLRQLNWMNADDMAGRGIRLFHYALLFPWQVRQKTLIYRKRNPRRVPASSGGPRTTTSGWATRSECTTSIGSPSWLERYDGDHPAQVLRMMEDVRAGRVVAVTRENADVEELLDSWWYPLGRAALKALDYPDRATRRARRLVGRLRHGIPGSEELVS